MELMAEGSVNMLATRLRAVGGGGSDPYWNNVAALLHFDWDLIDASNKNTYEFNSTSSFTGGMFLGGINPLGDYRNRVQANLSTPISLLDGQDFTFECFFCRTGNPISNAPIFIISNNISASNSNFKRLAVYQLTDQTLAVEFGDHSPILVANNFYFPLNTFVHIALVRIVGEYTIFIDGVDRGSIGAPSYSQPLTEITIGGMRDVIISDARSRTVNGVIDELRLTLGVARYTENFTPPTEPFPEG